MPPPPATPPRRPPSVAASLPDDLEKEAEKAEYLMEMQRIQAGHPHIRSTRKFTTADRHADIELEYNRLKIAADTTESVNFMSNCLKMGVSGVEMLNSRFGPWLSIDGFADEACADMAKYRPALTRIYKRVWRRGCMNPWVELLMLLGGGVLMFHFKSKLLGRAPPPRRGRRGRRPARGAGAAVQPRRVRTGAAAAAREPRHEAHAPAHAAAHAPAGRGTGRSALRPWPASPASRA